MISANPVAVGTSAGLLVRLNRSQTCTLIPAAAISVGTTQAGTTTSAGAVLPASVPVTLSGMTGTLYAVAASATTCAVIVGDVT